MSATVFVRRSEGLPAGLDLLVTESTREGHRFLERLRDDWRSGTNRFDGRGEALFVAYVDSGLAGICGLNQDPHASGSDVGRLRRLYVGLLFRRQGVGRCLVERALSLAREHYGIVRLRTDNSGAVAFYESLGFSSAGPPAEATHQLVLRDVVVGPAGR